ncbi:MAG: hypothetical protein KC464_02670, partial [Myxococcales bacterium]|nr:hypothetical protein [Myxococcales bacterium]
AIDPHDAGLGLYACRLAAEVHGGKLWVEDDAELPAVLACRLPAPLGPVAPTRGRIEGGT